MAPAYSRLSFSLPPPNRELLNWPVTLGLASFAVVLALATWGQLRAVGLLSVPRSPTPPVLSHATSNSSPTPSISDIRQLRDWLRNDLPIDDPAQDRFGARALAENLAGQITQDPDGTFGLIGPFGSGKTSLVKLAFRRLPQGSVTDRPRFIFCFVSEWGRSDVSASATVLSEAVKELSRHVDTLAVANLPGRYTALIDHTRPPWWLSLVFWGALTRDPCEELCRLNQILRAIDYHLIVAIEDTDRNSPREDLRHHYLQLQAMLDRLRDQDRITFILTASSAAFDLSRLCTWRTLIPSLAPEPVWTLIDLLRQDLSVAFPDDIDPRSDKARHAVLLAPDGEMAWRTLRYTQTEYGPGPVLDLCELLRNPRQLKQALRQFNDAYRRLHGEIDPDDLLLCCAIQVRSPAAFDYMQDYYHLLSGGLAKDRKKRASQEKALAEAWQARVKDCDSDDRDRVARLIGRLLGTAPDGQQSHPADQCLQGVNHARYWQRVYTGHIPPGQKPDQDALRALSEYKRANTPDSSALLAKFNDEDSGPVLQRLQEAAPQLRSDLRLSGSDLLTLAEHEFARLRQAHGSMAGHEHSQAFISLHEILKTRHPRPSNYPQWLTGQATTCLSTSLKLVLDIELVWARDDLDAKQKQTLLATLLQTARDLWSRNPSTLIGSLPLLGITWPYVLLYFRALYPDVPDNQVDWQWLPPVLLKALDVDAARIIPQICALIAEWKRIDKRNEYGESDVEIKHNLDKARACALLPTANERTMFVRALCDHAAKTPVGAWPAEPADLVKAVIADLANWLTEGCPDPNTSRLA